MSRKVYDACRRYKHFYKKHEDVKGWNNKYHDIDLTQAVGKNKAQLNDCTDELLLALFDEYNVCCTNMETSFNVPKKETAYELCEEMNNLIKLNG